MNLLSTAIYFGAVITPAVFQADLFQSSITCDSAAGEGSWKIDCNWCRCSADGGSLCTKMGCPPGSALRDPSDVECRGSPRFKLRNLWCTCSNGRALCDSPTSSGDVPSADCSAGGDGRWRKDCNWCRCTQNGIGVCTRRLCSSVLELRDPTSAECEGNPIWKNNDEWCSCIGGKAYCGLSGSGSQQSFGFQDSQPSIVKPGRPFGFQSSQPVPASIEPRETCDPSAGEGSWKENCNWCRCSARGGSLCTKIGCPPGPPIRDTSEVECRGNPRWKINNQWCSCVFGRASCGSGGTNNQQNFPQQQPPKENEVPSLSDTFEVTCQFTGVTDGWRKSCNWCRCTLKGWSVCTLRSCISDATAPQANEPVCRGNAKWKEDCNWCSCFQGKAVCTEAACF